MRPIRHPGIQAVLSRLMAGWMRLCLGTIRWRYENRELVEAVWAQGGPVIVAFWHSRLALAPAGWDHGRGQPLRVMISLSPDGQFIADAVARLGFPAIRGSSQKREDPAKAKGGSQALRDALKWLKSGGAVALTPDGPRGPVRQMGEGLPVMARMSGAPVLLLGLACRPAVQLNSWDRAMLPLPFGRGAVVWDRVAIGRDTDPATVVADWTARLTAVEARADALARG
ncbi:MAG: lysophospholipid acyltransferase family protein [Brevundimonas sp.]